MLVAIFATLLSACGDSSPGPLAGTWQVAGVMPMRASFRDGETEALGIIEKVDYKVEGRSVIVTYKDGLMKGSSVRFVLVNPTTMQAMGMTYRKIGS
jgi:hypothetical protein